MCSELVHVHFTWASEPYWWTKFTKPGFGHVYLIIPDKYGYTLVNPTSGILQVKHMVHGDHLPLNLQKPSLTVKFHTDESLDYSPIIRPYTCVEIVKRLLGINKAFIFTPYQLYRWLK